MALQNNFGDPGVAGGLYSEDIAGFREFMRGDTPPQVTHTYPLAPAQELAFGTVVGRNASGQIVRAVSGTTPAIGILAHKASSAAGDTRATVYLAGNYNVNALIYDASYNTAALKLGAFEGAKTPTNIVVGPNPYDAAVIV